MIILGVTSSSDKNVPTAPTIGTATNVGTGRAYNNGAATVTFTPTYSGGLPVTYTATSSPGGFTATGSSPITVTGLQSNTAYTFTVTATNSLGSATSAASNSITATTVPQAPTIGTATDGGTGTTVSVAFTPGATGGSAITTYTATSSPGSFTGTAASSPITVSGLTAGTAYTFTVTATNANGTSQASAASNSVTPAVPGSYESIATATVSSATQSITLSSIPQTYRHLQLRVIARNNAGAAAGTKARISFNGDTSGSYNFNSTESTGNGSNMVGEGQINVAGIQNIWTASNGGGFGTAAGVAIIDIPDYREPQKYRTVTAHYGYCSGTSNTSSNAVNVGGGYWPSASGITSINVFCAQDMIANTEIALYGIKDS